MYRKTCLKQPLSKRPNFFQDKVSINAGQKYCRMLQREQSAIFLTFIKLTLSLRSLFCLFLSAIFTQILLYLHLLPIAGLIIINLNGYQI